MISVVSSIQVLGETNTRSIQLFQKTEQEEIVPKSLDQ